MIKKNKNNLFLLISIILFLTILILKIYFKEKPIQPFGITILEVSSNSMNPILYKGDIIIIKKEKEYKEGDIITFISEEKNCITHRIIKKYENVFITKGDNNNTQDKEEVNKEQILGKVIYIIKNKKERRESLFNTLNNS